MFEITEANGEKVVDPQKLKYIEQMLNVHTLEENYAVSSGNPLPVQNTNFTSDIGSLRYPRSMELLLHKTL